MKSVFLKRKILKDDNILALKLHGQYLHLINLAARVLIPLVN